MSIDGFDPLSEHLHERAPERGVIEEATQRVVLNILKSYTGYYDAFYSPPAERRMNVGAANVPHAFRESRAQAFHSSTRSDAGHPLKAFSRGICDCLDFIAVQVPHKSAVIVRVVLVSKIDKRTRDLLGYKQ
jgi:hypothetical protein